jgi:hypothetical protein
VKILALLSLLLTAGAASADDFWTYWGDGRAELDGYRLTQPRYGAKREGTAVLVYVTEDFSDSLRVKADPGKHPASDVFPVLKLNAVRDFQTGIYDYNVLTSVFTRVGPGFPLAKVSFSSQEWCGHVYHQLVPRAGRVQGVFHSYFDGEADGKDDLALPDGGIFEDALPVLVRGLGGLPFLKEGERRSVPFLPSLLRSRLEHRPLAWGQASLARAAETTEITVPAGRFRVITYTVAESGGRTVTYQVESAPPQRLVRWAADDGEEAVLLGSTREAYWKLNGPGGESHLKALGLPVPAPTKRPPAR